MSKCDFCGTTIMPGKGKIYIKTDGKILNFCSSKCEKNKIKLGRTARNLKWTKKFVKSQKV